MNDAARLISRVVIDPTGCWEWQGSIGSHGYGQISINSRPMLAHRLSHECFKGPIPEGLHIDHICRNRGCINPFHLEAVTPAVNTQRGNTSRFTADEIREMRESTESGAAVARRFNTTRDVISKIRRYERWAA